MPQKKVDQRIRVLLENGIKTNTRSFVVIIGDHARDQVVNLHYILSKAQVKARPSVLWCYKKELGFSTHKKKRMKQIKRAMSRGLYDSETENPFELFISSTNIRWCYYKETEGILGQTFGMCVLQDFEAITPNLLCRTIETVEGGGLVVLLLQTMNSLRQLYTLSMDVHSRFRTEAHQDVVARFNERFILSLSQCASCVILDEELNVLPLSKSIREIAPVSSVAEPSAELKTLKDSFEDSEMLGSLVRLARTVDQARSLLLFIDAIAEKSLRSTVTLTAGRGRGKSAALGVAIAAAVAHGYSNIFITAPSPENLGTVFQFLLKGFDALAYKDHMDYEVVQSTNPEFNHAIIRVNVFHAHRQTIQYILPSDHQKLAQAELVVIDEAAAIPLPLVKKLLGPYLVFLSSTVTGYEGTGRALSLKLIDQLRQTSGRDARVLKEITLEEPIRYSANDPVERWMNELLCLDVTSKPYRIISATPHPSECELYYVNRDSLFSYHKLSEELLHRMMSLYVSSHYKLLADAPAHRLFALLGTPRQDGALPDVLCVIQLCLEGEISQTSVRAQLSRGQRASGDLIPWTVSQQFQDNDFPALSGARVVRIATHPDVAGMGYGSRSLELLQKYYQCEITNMDEISEFSEGNIQYADVDIHAGSLKPRKVTAPLLVSLQDRPPEKLHWLGVAYGLTEQLYKFWCHRSGYLPVYLRLTENELTGEHSCIMLKAVKRDDIEGPEPDWIQAFRDDFQRRFLSLLAFECRGFASSLSMYLLDPPPRKTLPLDPETLPLFVTLHDIQRLEAYSRNLVDYHMVIDLLPALARLYFLNAFPDLGLSYIQKILLIGQGLQHKSVDALTQELSLPSSQALALFNKMLRKLTSALQTIAQRDIERELRGREEQGAKQSQSMKPLRKTLDQDLTDGAAAAAAASSTLLEDLDLKQFELKGTEDEWENGLQKSGPTGVISIKSSAPPTVVDRSERDKETKSTSESFGGKKRNRRESGGSVEGKKRRN